MLPEYVMNAADITAMNSSPEESSSADLKRTPVLSSSAQFKPFCLKDSTEEHFRSREDEKQFYGAYGHIREKLDYSQHSHYQKQRLWLHDSIIDDILNHTPQAEAHCEPWLVIVAGDAGTEWRVKMEELVSANRLPLTSMVFVDRDEIRHYLPEYSFFIQESPDLADSQTEKECGYIAETLTSAALQSGRNVIYDISRLILSSIKSNIDSLRSSFLSLKVGLIYILASPPAVPGCSIDKEETLNSITFTSESLARLKPDVDYYCTIIDNFDELQLIGDDWEHFRKVFEQPRSVDVPKFQHLPSGDNIIVCPKRQRLFSVLFSSEENYRSHDKMFYGRFAHIRAALDYSYHSNYTFERQLLQDAIISEFLDATFFTDRHGIKCTTPTEPWVVFTAGAMGSGKSFTMRTLVDRGLFPLLAFVRVDPDELRRYLPEFYLYIQQSPENAGTLTRKEAGLISEILTLAALQEGKNVLVDGSLRDSSWYRHYFEKLRSAYPHVRLAIIHVSAPREMVLERASRRAHTSGRIVPEELLLAAIEEVPKSVRKLAPLVDYHVELENADEIRIVKPSGETWDSFKATWTQTCAWVPSSERLETVQRKASDLICKGEP